MDNIYDVFNDQDARQESAELGAFDKDEYKARKQAERESVYSLIDETTEKMQGNVETFMDYLDVQARFDRYSVSNAILITAKVPEAIGPLKTFDEWKADGVYVKKGEEAIPVLEPGKEYEREDGSTGVNYNVKKVFDISQTNSRVTSTPVVVRDERLLLKALISHAPCTMKVSDRIAENVNAVYSPGEKVIYVRPGLDAPEIFRAISQELAHAHMDKDTEASYKRSENQNAAGCVAYLLCKRYGVSTDFFASIKSTPEQYAKMEKQSFRKELAKVRDIAGEISRDMNRVLETQERTAKNRSDDAR